MPRFHAIVMTFNSVDVITQTLNHVLTWADAVYVCDTGSSDGTSDVIEQFARHDHRIKTWHWKPVVFHEGLRSLVFERYRHLAEEGDWFVQNDEDEFFHLDPRSFVADHCRPHETAVWIQNYEFRLTRQEVAQHSGHEMILARRQIPVEKRLLHFEPLAYSEHRMFRYRKSMVWRPRGSFPLNHGFIARETIPMRHYPHRDVLQLEARVEWRRKLLKRYPVETYPHWKVNHWTEYILDENDSRLRRWDPDTKLPEYNFTTHLASPFKRFVQRTVHAVALPLLDRCRQPFPKDYRPEFIED